MLFLVLHSQTTTRQRTFIACSISTRAERIWNTSYTLFVLAAHPHRRVLIDSCGFLNLNSAFIRYTIELLVTLVCIKPDSEDSLRVIIGVMDEEQCILCLESFENNLNLAIQYPNTNQCD